GVARRGLAGGRRRLVALPCPVWRGGRRLDRVLTAADRSERQADRHAAAALVLRLARGELPPGADGATLARTLAARRADARGGDVGLARDALGARQLERAEVVGPHEVRGALAAGVL